MAVDFTKIQEALDAAEEHPGDTAGVLAGMAALYRAEFPDHHAELDAIYADVERPLEEEEV